MLIKVFCFLVSNTAMFILCLCGDSFSVCGVIFNASNKCGFKDNFFFFLRIDFDDFIYMKFKRKSSLHVTSALMHYKMFDVVACRKYTSLTKFK